MSEAKDGAAAGAPIIEGWSRDGFLGERAGLVRSERASRTIQYRVDFAGMRRLLGFLMQDCCNGAPELCADLLPVLDCHASA
jgi:hypothetical protein